MKDPDQLSKEEKIAIGIETLRTFFDSLGEDDIYKQIVIEELFKILLYGDSEPSED